MDRVRVGQRRARPVSPHLKHLARRAHAVWCRVLSAWAKSLAAGAHHSGHCKRFCPPFCNGPVVVNPRFATSFSPGTRFCTGSAQGRHLIGFAKDRSRRSTRAWSKSHMGGHGLTLSSSPARGLRFGKAGVENPPENRDPLLLSWCALPCSSSTLQRSYLHGLPLGSLRSDRVHAATAWLGSLWSNGFPSTSIRCMITASLRASATLAFAMPMRLASCMAHVLSAEAFTGRVRMMCAA